MTIGIRAVRFMEAFDEITKPADNISFQLNMLLKNEELHDLKSSFGRMIHDAFEKSFGQKTYNCEDPAEASRITSKSNHGGGFSPDEGDSTKSTGLCDLITESVAQPCESQDFCVVTSEEAKSDPTAQLASSYQVLNTLESQRVTSIFLVVDKDNDDSTELASFQFNEIGEAEVNAIDRKNPESLTEFTILHNKLNCPDCFHIGLIDSHSIFDRGKYFGKLILRLGFKSDYGDSILPLCVHDDVIHVDGELLVKMPTSVAWKLGSVSDDFHLQLQQGKVGYTITRDTSVFIIMHFARWIYDRGKGFFNFADAYSLAFGTHSSGMIILIGWIFLDAHCEKLGFDILAKFWNCLEFLFEYSHMYLLVKNGDSCDAGLLFNKRPYPGSILCTILILQAPRQWVLVKTGDMGDNSKMLAEFGGDWNLVADFSTSIRFLFLLWARVVCIENTRQWTVHIFLFPTAAGIFLGVLFRVIINRHEGDVHHILLQELPMNQQVVKQCILSSLNLSSFSWYFPCCSSQMNAPLHPASKFLVFHYHSLMLLLSLFNTDFSIFGRGLYVHPLLPTPNVYSSCLLPACILMGTQIFVVVFQILKIFVWVGYLRWKFRLVLPALCGVRNIRWIGNIIISVRCLDINWNDQSNWFCKSEVHNHIAATLRKSNLFLTSLWSSWNTSGTICLYTDLPETSVSFGYGRLLFDRGKKLASMMMTFTTIGDAKFNCVIAGIYTKVSILHGFTPRQSFTEVYVVTFVIMFIDEVQTHPTVCDQIEVSLQLTSKKFVHCQVLEAGKMVKQLRHLIYNSELEDMGTHYFETPSTHELHSLAHMEG